ncbi:MAG TPA: outer membrane protein assembly factor BamD [Terriglobales bacterium]|nr:outer membrane protein assembly factor BamD [Terriglobales bacterium]
MVRKVLIILILAVIAPLSAMAGLFGHKKTQNPLANVDSKQPDKVLFDRSMDFMKHSKYEQARTTLLVLINTYPDSEYIARAKLSLGDAWYAEGGTTGLAQAEIEYKDFITFFPNMPEAAEAQLKVANIHYRQMEKPDRDFTHAKRAEEEYQQLILQFPDSKLVPQAKQRLREVQEVLAEREYGIGRFYYMRESWPAAIARLKTAVDTYPLYSKAPDALYTLGEIYEKEIQRTRDSRIAEGIKGKLIPDLTNKAAEAYSRIVLNYPMTDRAGDAKRRLQALGRPIPTPSSDAIAQDKAIEASRKKNGRMDGMMRNFHRAPDVKQAAGTGEPTMTPPAETSAVAVIRETTNTLNGTSADGGNAVSLEVRNGEVPKSEAVPHSDAQNQPAPQTAAPAPQVANPASSASAPAPNAPASSDTGIPELKPIDSGTAPQTADPAPAATSNTQNQAAPASTQTATQASDAKDNGASSAQQNDSAQNSSQDQTDSSSSSKKGKKKGLRKIVPF